MKKYILLFLVASISLIAQEKQDVIYLKNGDIIKGEIVENVPNVYVRIELTGGTILTYNYDKIEKFTKEFVKNTSLEKNLNRSTILRKQHQTDIHTSQYSNAILTNSQKNAMYENQKKSPATARVLSFLISSTGHAYAGNWGAGLAFLGGRVLCVGAAVNAETEEEAKGWLIGLVALAIWEIVDAGNEAEKYNRRLYNKIYGSQSFGINISPMKQICNIPVSDGVQLNFSYNF
ncbi:MAG: hypothetical protein ACEPO8_07410 [Rhodothermaceae bacterium]